MEDDRASAQTLARRILGWSFAVALIVGWIVLLHAPGTIPWAFVAVATVAAIVLVATIWNSRPRGGADTVKH